ncbi:adenosine deaminase [Candidatus Peregrinibacteria bacterium]|nr:adenosine deaminase [Candidatus Peregrinibacteria bacterium]
MKPDRTFLENMPKIEMHLHLDGAINPEDIWCIAQEYGVTLPHIPEQSLDALKTYFQFDDSRDIRTSRDFDHLLRTFDIVISLMQTPEGLQDVAETHVRDLAAQNFVYAETRFAPQYHLRKGLTLEGAIENTLIGLQRGFEKTGTLVKLIACIGRENVTIGPEVARAALKYQDKGVVAIDLACNEIDYPPELHVDAFRLTFGSNLRRCVHAGEVAKTPEKLRQNIITSLIDLRADELGHAILLPDMPEAIEHVVQLRTRIASCPLSNLASMVIDDVRDLRLQELLDRNVLVSLHSDDPAMDHTSLADVFVETCKAYNFDINHVQTLSRNAIFGAFCSAKEREWIFEEFRRRGFDVSS